MFVTLRSIVLVSFQQITFKLGRFPDYRALFLVLPTEFLKRVHVKKVYYTTASKRFITRVLHSWIYCWLKQNGPAPCIFFF